MIKQPPHLFDERFPTHEQFPRKFEVHFNEMEKNGHLTIIVTIDGEQVGDAVTDNSYQEDYYRFHDVFHYSHAAILGWSPCARAMLQKKRKSDKLTDEIEDGARAQIAEEAICGIIFAHARKNNFFNGAKFVEDGLLELVSSLTYGREVSSVSKEVWEKAILQSFAVWRQMRDNHGGVLIADLLNKSVSYRSK